VCFFLLYLYVLVKAKHIFTFCTLVVLPLAGMAQIPDTPVPYTLEDRDRSIRAEIELSSLRKEVFSEINALRTEINIRFESQQQQMDDLKSIFFWSSSLIISLILMMFGYMIWDRRTILKPFEERSNATRINLEKLKEALIEAGRTNPDIEKALKNHGVI